MTELTTERRQAVRTAVRERRGAIVAELLDFVGTPSVTGTEAAVQDVIQRSYERRGLTVDRWEATPEEIAPYVLHVGEQARYANRPNLVGRRASRSGATGRSILLQGHIDTVDAGDPVYWTRNPWGEATPDRVYGRGAADMKAGIITHLAALDALDAAGVTLAGDVLLASSVGEEDGGLGAMATILRGHRTDAAIITEPTNLSLVVAQGGSLVFRITVTGRSAHGAARNEGVSAFEKFVPIFQDLLAWEDERNRTLSHPLYDHLENKFPISVGTVQAGTWASTVPETLVAGGRLGFLPGETIEGMQAAAEKRIRRVAEGDPWLSSHPPLVEWVGGQFASTEISSEEPIARAVAAGHRAVTGTSVKVEGVSWGADMRLFKEIAGIPTVLYGAGDVRNVHCPDEFIEIDDLLLAVETLAVTLADWCGVA
jgi:acetylornithine deacetylase